MARPGGAEVRGSIPLGSTRDNRVLSAILGNRKAPGAKHGGYYTNYYTNPLRKRRFHSRDRAILHVRQDVAVGIQRYRNGRVA